MNASDITFLSPSDPRLSLNGLPTELVLRIVRATKGDNSSNDWKGLSSLALVSRRFNFLSIPFIYENFDTRNGHPYLFLRTISAVPDLAKYVKHICWGHGSQWTENHPLGKLENIKISEVFGPTTAWPLTTPIDLTTPSQREQIWDSLRTSKGIWSGELGVKLSGGEFPRFSGLVLSTLLVLSPGVERLDVAAWALGDRGQNPKYDRISYHLENHHTKLATLRTLKIECNIQEQCDLRVVFGLETLRHLEMKWLLFRPGLNNESLKYRCSNIDTLILRVSYVDSTVLANMIGACKNLRSLMYEHSRIVLEQAPRFGRDIQTNLALIISALQNHSETLENLALVDEDITSRTSFQTDTAGILPSLTGFSQLSNIFVPLWSVCNMPEDDPEIGSVVGQFAAALPPNTQFLGTSLFLTFELVEQCENAGLSSLPSFKVFQCTELSRNLRNLRKANIGVVTKCPTGKLPESYIKK